MGGDWALDAVLPGDGDHLELDYGDGETDETERAPAPRRSTIFQEAIGLLFNAGASLEAAPKEEVTVLVDEPSDGDILPAFESAWSSKKSTLLNEDGGEGSELLHNDRHGRPESNEKRERWRHHSRRTRAMAVVASPSSVALEVASRDTLCCLLFCQYLVIGIVAFSIILLFRSNTTAYLRMQPCNASNTDSFNVTTFLFDWSPCSEMARFPVNAMGFTLGKSGGGSSSRVAEVTAKACYTPQFAPFDSVVFVEVCQLASQPQSISAIGLGFRVINSSFPNLAPSREVSYDVFAGGCVSSECTFDNSLLMAQAIAATAQADKTASNATSETYDINAFVYSNPYNALRHAKYIVIFDEGSGFMQAPMDEAAVVLTYRTLSSLWLVRYACAAMLALVAVRWVSSLWHVRKVAHRKWLVEWTWLSMMLVGAIFAVNPIVLALSVNPNNDAAGAMKNTFWLLAFGEFFTAFGTMLLWLGYWMMADRPMLVSLSSKRAFYGRKVAFIAFLFLLRSALIILSYPLFWGQAEMELEAPQSWARQRQLTYVIFSVVDQVLSFGVVLEVIYSTIRSRKILKRLPYLSMRRTALGFQLFMQLSMFGWLVLILVMAASIATGFSFYMRGGGGNTTLQEVTSAQYAQHVAVGDDSIAVAYNTTLTIILLYMYGPVRWLSLSDSDKRILVTWEEQLPSVATSRKRAYGKLPEKQLRTLTYSFDSSRVFCVETARWLLNMAQQAYRDWPDEPPADQLPSLDVEQFGFDLVARFRDEPTDTRAIVARHRRTRRLVVAFRGTKSKAHFKTDLEYKLLPINASLLVQWGAEESLPEYLQVPLHGGFASTAAAASSASTTNFATNESVGQIKSAFAAPTAAARERALQEQLEPLCEKEAAPAFGAAAAAAAAGAPMPEGGHLPSDHAKGRTSGTTSKNNGTVFASSGNGHGSGSVAVSVREGGQAREAAAEGAAAGKRRGWGVLLPGRRGVSTSSAALSQAEASSTSAGAASPSCAEAYPAQGDWEPSTVLPWDRSSAGAGPLSHVPEKVRLRMAEASPRSCGTHSSVYGRALVAAGRYEGLDPVTEIKRVERDLGRLEARAGVHSGFFRAYSTLRERIHAVVVDEMAKEPARLYFTGHSLGGALATLASYDCALHLLPRLKAAEAAVANDATASSRRGKVRRSLDDDEDDDDDVPSSKIKMGVYTFGSPKVGNREFVKAYNMLVPFCWRVVVDGDVITGVPPSGYDHVGVAAVVDRFGAGHCILNPGASEQRYRTQRSISIACHMFPQYIRGVEGLMRPLTKDHEQMIVQRPWTALPRTTSSVASVLPPPPARKGRLPRWLTGRRHRSSVAAPGPDDTGHGGSQMLPSGRGKSVIDLASVCENRVDGNCEEDDSDGAAVAAAAAAGGASAGAVGSVNGRVLSRLFGAPKGAEQEAARPDEAVV